MGHKPMVLLQSAAVSAARKASALSTHEACIAIAGLKYGSSGRPFEVRGGVG